MSDDIAIEPVPGLPEDLPTGERMLWQGKPDAWALAREGLSLHWVVGWFVLLALWRFTSIVSLAPLSQALWAATMFLVLGLLAGAILFGIAWVQAKLCLYTITSERVVMRVGAALTLTLNLPFTKMLNADLDLRRGGTGTIALDMVNDAKNIRLSYLMLWPHVRPWNFQTQPALRCIPDAERVAHILADAADTRVSRPEIARTSAAVAAE